MDDDFSEEDVANDLWLIQKAKARKPHFSLDFEKQFMQGSCPSTAGPTVGQKLDELRTFIVRKNIF